MTGFKLPDDHEVAAKTVEKRVEWLIDQRIPRGMITLVAGRPGQGKSLFTAWLAAHVSQMGEGVLFSNLEDLRGAVSRPRLRVAGADLERVHFWTPDLSSEQGIAMLETMVVALKISLLVIDPLSAHLSRRVMDDRSAITPLKELCERTGLSIVALHHTRKNVPKNSHALDAVKGAGDGFMANARFVYLFGRNVDDDDQRVLACAKTNVAQEGSITFAFDLAETEVDGEEVEIARLVLVDPLSNVEPHKIMQHGTKGQEGGDPAKRAVAAEWLTSVLMFGEVDADTLKDKAEDSGLAWRTLRRAGDQLGVTKRAEHRGFGKGRLYYWALPEGHPALQIGAAAAKAAGGKEELPEGLTVEELLAGIDAAGTVNPHLAEEEDDA